MGGVLAIDHGERKTGFAAADALRVAVRPLTVERHDGSQERLLARVAAFADELSLDTLLVGRPVQMHGRVGERARSVEAFARDLRQRFPALQVVLYDERLTTKEAESLLREEGFRGREIAERKDSWAALVLLRDWIASGEPTA